MLQKGDQIGIVACSNGLNLINKEKIEDLLKTLRGMGLMPVCSPYLFASEGVFSGTGKEKAEALMNLYKDDKVKMIFDISGGDIANETLSYMDFEIIKNHPKPFWGYSDLSTIVNAIYAQTQQETYLYQIRNLVLEDSNLQQARFKASMFEGKQDLFESKYDFIQGRNMEGIVVGGNIRCLLKLAGTPYMPDFTDKILFLEAMGGESAQMITYLNQLRQMNVFKQIKGILLGTFIAMEKNECIPTIEALVLETLQDSKMPVAKTSEIGHRSNSKALVIGRYLKI